MSNNDEARKRRPRSIPSKLAEYSMNVDFVIDAISSGSLGFQAPHAIEKVNYPLITFV